MKQEINYPLITDLRIETKKGEKIEINSVCGLSIIGSTTAKQLYFNQSRPTGSPSNTLYIVTELHGELEFNLSEIDNIKFVIVNEDRDIVVESKNFHYKKGN